MEWLKTLAPLLGAALGTPLVGVAASFIADKLELEDKTIEAVTEALNSGKMTPEQLTSLKLAEIDFQKFLKENDIKLEEIAAADRGSAREMQITVRSNVPAWLTFFLTIGFFSVLGLMFFKPEVKESAPLMIMLGSLGTAWTSSVAFWFGTTHGSQVKNNMLANSTPVR